MLDLENKINQLNDNNKYDKLKDIINSILVINHIYDDTCNILAKCGKKLNSCLFINKDINNLIKCLDNILDKKDSVKMFHELLQNNIFLVRSYFLSLLSSYGWRKPNINKATFSIASNELIKYYAILEEILFKYGNTALLEIEHKNKSYFISKDISKLQKIQVNKTCFEYFSKEYLDNIWNQYSEQLLLKARRGPKLMLILFFLYEEYFTNEMFDILIDRMNGYKNIFYVNYIINCSQYLNEDKKNRLKALKLTLNLI